VASISARSSRCAGGSPSWIAPGGFCRNFGDWNRRSPASDHLDTIIEYSIKLPLGGRQGPQIDRQSLRPLAPRSFPHYRGLLGLSAYWDRYGRSCGGAYATADNPEADRWPVLTPETLRLILFPAGRDNRNTERSDRKRAVAHVKSMEAEGLVEMVPAGAGWRAADSTSAPTAGSTGTCTSRSQRSSTPASSAPSRAVSPRT